MKERDVMRLAIETGAGARTIRRWAANPADVSALARYALDVAAVKLGIAVRYKPERKPARRR